MAKEKIYRYVGEPGAFVMGVPTRDLMESEWNALEAWQRKAALRAMLYVIESETEKENGKLSGSS